MSADTSQKIVVAAVVGAFIGMPLYATAVWGVSGLFVSVAGLILWGILYFGAMYALEVWIRRADAFRNLNDYAEVRRQEMESLRGRSS